MGAKSEKIKLPNFKRSQSHTIKGNPTLNFNDINQNNPNTINNENVKINIQKQEIKAEKKIDTKNSRNIFMKNNESNDRNFLQHIMPLNKAHDDTNINISSHNKEKEYHTINYSKTLKKNLELDVSIIKNKKKTRSKSLDKSQDNNEMFDCMINHIEKKVKNKEDLEQNININNIIKNSREENKNVVEDEPRFNLTKRRSYTYSTLDFNISEPQNIFLFDDINIFDSILIILNYNSYINSYLSKNKKKIYSSEEKNEYCLSSILYYINKYLWTTKPEKIMNAENLKYNYQKFLDWYIKDYSKNSNFNCYNAYDISLILDFIYNKINNEITFEYIGKNSNNQCKEAKELLKLCSDFINNNKSPISDNYYGVLSKESWCINCMNRVQRYGYLYVPIKDYSIFNIISFDLSYINNNISQIIKSRATNLNQFGNNISDISKIKINYVDCFNQYFFIKYQSFCNMCKLYSLIQIKKYIYAPPNMLTIILNNNLEGNFIINDEISLDNFTYQKDLNSKYYLVSMICKYPFKDRYITYCFNYKNRQWYYYTKRGQSSDNISRKTTYVKPNAIPYVLFYQNKADIENQYSKINLDYANNKIKIRFRFQDGSYKFLFFENNAKVKDAINDIGKYFEINNIKLVSNGLKAKDDDLLCSPVFQGNEFLVISC